ncbi:MAG: CHAT domain-containing protein [Cyanobacteria bacterium CRU_2_1]|nr:CHAT domain-containing protein [Cyanobacteria bacterium CRU_2_1]
MIGATRLAPLFKSDLLLFPWEVLYEGDYRDGKPESFWGLRYPVARHLIPSKLYAMELALPTDMLFCLNHRLPYAPQQERPAIEILARKTGKFSLLRTLTHISSGETFLEHLYQARHNVLHFACHCRPCKKYEDDIDALLISLVEDETNLAQCKEIELETYNFDDIDGFFQAEPLVFLNACQSGGGLDELRKTFNLPARFIEHGAGAVIATVCEVPDSFAALFSKVFYEFFLDQKMMIGDALHKTRWYFLTEYNNPLGLAYGLYSPAYYRLAQPPMMEGAA